MYNRQMAKEEGEDGGEGERELKSVFYEFGSNTKAELPVSR